MQLPVHRAFVFAKLLIFLFVSKLYSCIIVVNMNEDIKIIFSDIDWTLLNHGHGKHEFDMPSIEALKEVQQKGVKVFLCTARPYHSVKGCGILDLFAPDGIVCTNGAVAFVGEKIIHNASFPKEHVNQIIKVAHKHHLTLELSNEKDRWLTKKKNKYVDAYFSVFTEIVPEIRKYKGENISAILCMGPAKFDKQLQEELPAGVNLYRYFDYGLDINYRKIEKSEGMNEVLKYLNISKDNAMALGDDLGDIPMFNLVKYSVCMENGKEAAKIAAKEICPNIDNHGVAIVLEKYFK